MSIDVEGAELSLLRSVNWRRVRVRIMVVERPSVEVRQLLRDEAQMVELPREAMLAQGGPPLDFGDAIFVNTAWPHAAPLGRTVTIGPGLA